MLWWFERDGRRTIIEVLNLPTGEFELRTQNPDGTEDVEYFTDAVALAKRQQAIHNALFAKGWARSGEWRL